MIRSFPIRSAITIGIIASAMAFGPPFRLAAAEEKTPTVDEIVHRANLVSYYQGRDGGARVAMTITDRQGRTRRRRLTILRRDVPESDSLKENAYHGSQKFYVYFHRPADVSKMVFLVWKFLDRDDDRWLYLPALDLVKRIAATDKRTSFVGSDFLYEDISGRSIYDDVHELIETTSNFYVLKNTPKDPDSVEFAYYKMFIHKGTFLPVQSEYYDKSGKKYRLYKALKVEIIQGFPAVTQASMENLNTGSKTVVRYSDVRFEIGLPENIFTERFLRRAPMKYLRR
ncbi:MAG: outer membrane lipoprotein-sorting protein [Phycisphaerae bacterium]